MIDTTKETEEMAKHADSCIPLAKEDSVSVRKLIEERLCHLAGEVDNFKLVYIGIVTTKVILDMFELLATSLSISYGAEYSEVYKIAYMQIGKLLRKYIEDTMNDETQH